MRQIGIDYRMAEHSGIGTYVKNLTACLDEKKLSASLRVKLYGGEEFSAPIYSISEQVKYPALLGECDLWHAPHYNVPFFKGKSKLCVTVHDLIHWIFRKEYFNSLQSFYARTMLKRTVKISDRIITVSEHTKGDLIRHFNADPEKVSVIYEGVDTKFFDHSAADAAVLKKYGIAESYFLYVGNLKPHKQVDKLVRIFRSLRREGKIKSDLVIVGKKDRRYGKSHQMLENLKSGEGLHYLNFIADPELISLYNKSLALVHPSRYEGFGLTLLEAMASGTAVLASRAASIPEIVGDAAYLFDPDSNEELAQGMILAENDFDYRCKLIRLGSERVRLFSWQKMADQTLDVYKEILSL